MKAKDESLIHPALRDIVIKQADRDMAADFYGRDNPTIGRRMSLGELDNDNKVLAFARGRIFREIQDDWDPSTKSWKSRELW